MSPDCSISTPGDGNEGTVARRRFRGVFVALPWLEQPIGLEWGVLPVTAGCFLGTKAQRSTSK